MINMHSIPYHLLDYLMQAINTRYVQHHWANKFTILKKLKIASGAEHFAGRIAFAHGHPGSAVKLNTQGRSKERGSRGVTLGQSQSKCDIPLPEWLERDTWGPTVTAESSSLTESIEYLSSSHSGFDSCYSVDCKLSPTGRCVRQNYVWYVGVPVTKQGIDKSCWDQNETAFFEAGVLFLDIVESLSSTSWPEYLNLETALPRTDHFFPSKVKHMDDIRSHGFAFQ